MADKEEGPAVSKRLKISQVRQEMTIIVLVASMIFGVCLVLGIYFVKNIKFNAKVISEKESSIVNYEKTISNVGVCKDINKDGTFSDRELKNCNPDNLTDADVPGSLRANVMGAMSENTELESVARASQSDCFNEYGNRINFKKRYQESQNDEDRELNLAMLKMCSALRVVPDALPAQKNEEALMASLNQIFILSNWDPESLSPSGENGIDSAIGGVSTIPVRLSLETTPSLTLDVLSNIENSIRTFNIQSATISWSSSGKVSFSAQGQAFYVEGAEVVENTKTVYATDKKKGTAK